MAAHAKNTLICSGVLQVINLFFTIAAAKATRAESLIAGENGQVINFFIAYTAMVRTRAANQRAITKNK